MQNNRLDFLREIVSLIPDIQTSGDEQLDHHTNYTDYYSINTSNNHNRVTNNIQRQFSHPSTSNYNTITVKKVNLNTENSNTNEVNQLLKDNQIIGTSLSDQNNLKPTASASSFSFNNSNKRFNTYSRSNSAPCTTNEMINASNFKNKRRLKKNEELTNFEDLDEEDEEDYELSSDEDESRSSNKTTDNNLSEKKHDKQINELPSCSSTVLDNKLEDSCKVSTSNKLDFEDDDYDA